MRSQLMLALMACSLPLAAQAPAFHVTGRVVDESHQPLPNVTLSVGFSGKGEAVGASDAEGRFRVRLPDHGDNTIYSRMSEFLELEAKGRLIARVMVGRRSIYGFRRRNLGGQDLGTVVLPKGRPIQVRIRKQDGRPLPGAIVIADNPLPASSFPFLGIGTNDVVSDYFSRGVTDEKGATVVHGHGDDAVMVLIEAEGYYRKHVPFLSPGMPLVVAMEESGFVSGKVVDYQGKPVQALLSMVSEAQPPSHAYSWTLAQSRAQNFTAKDGTFRLNLDYPHRYLVAANMVMGTSFYHHPSKSSRILTGPQKDVVIQLDKPKGVEGGVMVEVVDADSKEPVAGFRAAALWQDLQHVNDAFLEAQFEGSALTATEKGKILLPPPPTARQHRGGVMIKAAGYATKLVKDVDWEDDKPVKVKAELSKDLPIRGAVVDEDTGKPVVGALVWATRKKQNAMPFPFPGMEQSPGVVLTDDKGRFCLRGLGKGRHKVYARHPERPTLKPKSVNLKVDEPLGPLTLKMSKGFRYAGKVKGGHHRPGWKLRLLAKSDNDMRMRFLGAMSWDSAGVRTTAIAADGKFALEGLKKGCYAAYLLVPRLGGAALQIMLPDEIEIEEDQENVEVDLSKALPGRLRGKVAVNGIPAPSGRLILLAEQGGGAQAGLNVFVSLGSTASNGPRTTIRRDGTFDLQLAPGKYLLKVVDAATGITLWQDRDRIEVEAGKASQQAITVDLALVRVRLKPKVEGGQIVASHLGVKVDWPKQEQAGFGGMVLHAGGESSFGGLGLPLAPGQRDVDLYLPPRETRLVVHSNARSLEQGQQAGAPPPLAEYELTPEIGTSKRIELKVSAPPKLANEH